MVMNRKKYKLGICKFFAILFSLFCLFPQEIMAAEDNIKITSTVVTEDEIYVYIRGIGDIQTDSTVQIGTTLCDKNDISVNRVSEMDVPIRTIMLVDNSYSIPSTNHEDINRILKGIVEKSLPNEQFKVGTFSNTLDYLCDFTADLNTVNSSIDGIEYKNQDTYFSDVLYELIKEINTESSLYYTRIIMISDGADDNEIGFTNSEVQTFVNESGIPVYTIGVRKKNNNSELETMFSFSRTSNSEYYLLGDSSVDEIISGFTLDQKNICICIRPDTELMDGSNKNILLRLQTDSGLKELTTSVNMPFISDELIQNNEESSSSESENSETVVQEDNLLPTIGGEEASDGELQESNEKDTSTSHVMIIALIVVSILIIIGIFILFVLLKSKKNKDTNNYVNNENNTRYDIPADIDQGDFISKESEQEDKTVVLTSKDSGDKTVGLWDSNSSGSNKNTYLVLSSLDEPNIMNKVPIRDIVHIGRKNADIVVNDKFVSSKHCDIILKNGLLYIKDVGSSNGTFYENMKVTEEVPLANGGKIRLGKSNFKVELYEE